MSDIFNTKKERCRYSHMDLVDSNTLIYRCKKQDYKVVCDADCNSCNCYNSRFIEYPVTINGIEQNAIDYSDILYKSYVGKPVAVKPCDSEKTYLGLFIGEVPSSSTVSLNKEGFLSVSHLMNPAMFVPELNKIILGCESWWRILENEEEFKEITNDDINNVWYVQALKSAFHPEK